MFKCSFANEDYFKTVLFLLRCLPVKLNINTQLILGRLGLNQLYILQAISSLAFSFGILLVKQRGLILFDLIHHGAG